MPAKKVTITTGNNEGGGGRVKTLLRELIKGDGQYKPATSQEIAKAEKELNMTFSSDYKQFLREVGAFTYGSLEVYGLGVSPTSHLNIINVVKDFRNEDGFPDTVIPLSEIGDGHYYCYDNEDGRIRIWASPKGGFYNVTNLGLEKFLYHLVVGHKPNYRE